MTSSGRWTVLAAGALLGLAAGCTEEVRQQIPPGGTAGSHAGGAGGGAGQGGGLPIRPPAPPLAIDWTPCAIDSGKPVGNDAECAHVEVPADWYDPDGASIELFVKRFGAPDATQQIWLLMGGPGGAGSGYEGMGKALLQQHPSLMVYLLDHRGTGRSSRLGCSVAEGDQSDEGWIITLDEWPSCAEQVQAEWGELLPLFRTTQAAIDLGVLIEQTRMPGQWVHVHGGSYGTYWAQRYLQLFPEQATAVSLIGVASPLFNFGRYDQQYEDIGEAFLAHCAADYLCAGKMGPDAAATMHEVWDDIGGKCPGALAAGLTRDVLREQAGGLMLWGWHERVLPMAVAYRIARCDPADVTALQHYAANLVDPLAGLKNDRLFSSVINTHVSLSEMWSEPIPTLEQAQALVDGALYALGTTLRRVHIAPHWPTYAEDQFGDGFALTDVPVLMLEGTLDPASPPSQADPVGAHYLGEHQHYVLLPGVSHSWTSPTKSGGDCAWQLMHAFIDEPTAPLQDCWNDIQGVSFAGTPSLASMFGTSSVWENYDSAAGAGPSSPSPPVPPDAATRSRLLEIFQRARAHQH